MFARGVFAHRGVYFFLVVALGQLFGRGPPRDTILVMEEVTKISELCACVPILYLGAS